MNSQNTHVPLEEPIEPDLGRWKVKRNIHYWVMGLLVAVIATFMLLQAFRDENPDPAALAAKQAADQKQNAALNKTNQAPAKEDLEQAFARQQKEAESRQGQLPENLAATAQGAPAAQLPNGLVTAGQQRGGNLPPLPPGAGRVDAGLPSPDAMQQGQNQEAVNAARREEQVLSSAIMAIDNNSRVASGPRSSLDQSMLDLNAERKRIDAEGKAEREAMFNRSMDAARELSGGAGPRGGGEAAGGGASSFYENLEKRRTADVEVARPIASRGRYALMQGAIIPSVLITEIRSDLPGDLKAQTTMDVYSSNGGSVLLIPKGSVLVGVYNSEVKMGQEKVMAAFTRLIYPSGASVDLGGMKAAEGSGSAGLSDDVDNHFWKMFGTNFLIAGLAQVFQKDQGNVTLVNNGAGAANGMSNTAGQILSDTVRVVNERNRTIAPTIYVYRGHKFNVTVGRDMVLPPYETGVRQ